MYQKIIEIDSSSYIEISTRLVEGSELLCLTFRTSSGKKTSAISALLEEQDAQSVVKAINDALASRRVKEEVAR